ncbi:hypothetical protein POTOM_053261 [Populus tomentosa]|uniref:Disease resistance RPP13-like protein 1 n=1 Tax=Populus tomentosa TaxID=118781 RepID=A0A8X7YBP1_POPTO|nr:hypothetical protein POTOM_053261 [Populus tomentosa]
MALELIGGSILSPVIQVLVDRLASREVLGFFKSHKLDGGLLEKLNETLNTVNGLLDDAEEKQITNPEDISEEIDYEYLRSKDIDTPRPGSSWARNLVPFLNPANRRMKEMGAELQKILEKLERLLKLKGDLRHIEGTGGWRPLSEKTTPLVNEPDVYGRDSDKEAIMECLLTQHKTDDSNLVVVPIVGMGGVGKTTLAQLIYKDRRVDECFELKAWVWASQQFDVTRIIKDILDKIDATTCRTKEPDESLMEAVKGKKLLLVLDDAWNIEYNEWDKLLLPLRYVEHGSKIVVTTRDQDVAKVTQTVITPHCLKGIRYEDCWKLFARDAFSGVNSGAVSHLEAFGREIVRKCKGLPLAAKTLGGLLHSVEDVTQWEKISNSSFMHDLISDLAEYASGEFCFKLDINESGSGLEGQHLRALFLREVDNEALNDILPNLKSLRTLSLFNSKHISSQLLNSIGNLKHLRFLDLSRTAIERLPDSVCTLYYLQSLLLRKCRHLMELPSNISNLVNLQHLDIEGTNLEEMPPKMEKLTKLRYLEYYIVGKDSGSSMKVLGKLSYLRKKLSIGNLRDVANAQDALDADLKGKKKIEELGLKWDGNTDDTRHEREVLERLEPSENVKQLFITGYGGTTFPGWLGNSSFSNMVVLFLYGCKNCILLPPLGQLPSLEELQIKGLDEVVAVGPEFYGSDSSMENPFKSLKILKFEGMKKWQEWKTDVAFPHLAKLFIRGCPELTHAMPPRRRLLPSLLILSIKECPQLGDRYWKRVKKF